MPMICGRAARLLLLASFFLSGACSALPSGGAIPATPAQSPVNVKSFDAGVWDLPISGVRIAGSSFVAFDASKAKGMTGISALFGPLGVLLQNEAGKSDAAKGLGEQEVKPVDLDEMVAAALKGHAKGEAGLRPAFELTPSGWIAINQDGEKASAKLSIKLEAQWRGPDDDINWRQVYYYRVAQERPIAGTDGWFSNDGAALRQESGTAVSRLLALFLGEVAGAQPGDEAEIKLDGCFPLARKVSLVAETGDELVVRVQGNRTTGAQVVVMTRGDCKASR